MIAAQQTRKAPNIVPVIWGPSRVNTVGMDEVARQPDREEADGDQRDAEECVDGADPLPPGAVLDREAEHEVGAVEEEEDEEEDELVRAPAPPHPHDALAQIDPVIRVRAPKIVPWWIQV